MFELLIVFFIVYLVVKRHELGFLKNRFHITLGLLSIAWWIFLVIDQMHRVNLNCSPDDELCISGNTFWGDLTWGSLLAIYSLTLIWLPTILAGLYMQRKTHPTKK